MNHSLWFIDRYSRFPNVIGVNKLYPFIIFNLKWQAQFDYLSWLLTPNQFQNFVSGLLNLDGCCWLNQVIVSKNVFLCYIKGAFQSSLG